MFNVTGIVERVRRPRPSTQLLQHLKYRSFFFPRSPQCGFVEFVTSLPLSKVLADYNNDIRVFFSSCAPSSLHPSGIDPSVLDTFLRRSACTPTHRLATLVTLLFSCAGYCVVSYLLGIGDRHLDNLMLKTQVRPKHECG